MAEFVMKNLVRQAGLEGKIQVDSAAANNDEIGNGMHRGTRAKLSEMRIPFDEHIARKLTVSDGERYDLILALDSENLYYMRRILKPDAHEKIHLLLEYAGEKRDIADPWYTGNFDETYDDIDKGCRALLEKLKIGNK